MGPLFFLALFTGLSFAQIEEHFLDVTITTNIILVDTAYLEQQPASFGAPIGANTQWLTEENGVTKWIGVNTEHLTQLTSTTVDEQGSPVTTTQDVKATIVGEPPVDGILGQDLSVIITPAFLNEINTIKSELCVGGARKRALSCGIEFVDKIAATFDIYAGAEAAKWAGAGGALVVGGMFAAQAKKIAEGGGDIPLNMNINKDDFNKAKPVITKIITITKSNTVSIESSTASSTSSDLGAGGGKDPQETGLPGADCWLYTGSTPDTSNVDDSEDPDSDDEVSSLKIRRLAGRITYDPSLLDSRETPTDISSNPADLAKRALENLGNCPQTFPANFKASFMPGVKGIAKIPKDLWWWVPLPQTDAAGLCTISTLQKVPDDQVGGTPPVPIGYVQDPNAAGKKVSVDHIYEKSFLKDFFLSVFKDANNPRCQPFFDLMLQNSKYVNPTYPGKDKGSRMQLLFNLQPNVQNGAFLGLERNINSVKGSLMNPGLVGIQAVDERKELDATDKNLNLLNDIAMAWSVLKIPAAAEKMKTINNNIYRAFIAIDKLESCAPIKGGGNGPNAQTWASVYQDWISAFFRDRQAETIAYVTKIKQTIEAAPMTLTEAGGQEKNKFGRAFDAINAAFPDEHWVLDTSSLLDFSGDAIETIQKRDSSIIGFPGCDNPPPGQASSVVSSSPTPTPSALCVVRTLVSITHASI